MENNYEPHHFLDNYSALKGSLLEFILPFTQALLQLRAENNPFIDTEKEHLSYICEFIKKALINVAFITTDMQIKEISASFKQLIRQKIKNDFCFGAHPFSNLWEDFPTALQLAIHKNLKGEKVKIDAIKVKNPGKQTLWIRWESFPWVNNNNQITGIVIFIKDITENKKLSKDFSALYSRNELLEQFSYIFSAELVHHLNRLSAILRSLEKNVKKSGKTNPFIESNFEALKICLTKAYDICQGISLYCNSGNLTINTQSLEISHIFKILQKDLPSSIPFSIEKGFPQNLTLNINKLCAIQLFQTLINYLVKISPFHPFSLTIGGEFVEENYFEFTLLSSFPLKDRVSDQHVLNTLDYNYANAAELELMICRNIIEAYKGYIRFTIDQGFCITFSLPIYLQNEEEN